VQSINIEKEWYQIYEYLQKDTSLWDVFTRKEEYNSGALDNYHRFPFQYSTNTNVLYPHVSTSLCQQGYTMTYPEGKSFAVLLSHDIDDITISSNHILRSLIPYPLHRNMCGFLPLVKTKLHVREGHYVNFKCIVELEKKYDAVSTFYFLATEQDVFGKKYKLEDIREEILYVIDEQCEVGLHTGFHAFNNIDSTIKEKQELEAIISRKIVGVRNHLLQFTIPQSWEILAKAGFVYDSTLGYYDTIGFRNGMCHPFHPYNLTTKQQIKIMELPLNIIDIALFSYMKLSAEESWRYIKQLIDTVEQLHGVVTILWHNWTFSYPVSFAGLFGPEWTRLYEKILSYCQKKNAWMTTGKDLCAYYKKS